MGKLGFANLRKISQINASGLAKKSYPRKNTATVKFLLVLSWTLEKASSPRHMELLFFYGVYFDGKTWLCKTNKINASGLVQNPPPPLARTPLPQNFS